MGFKHICCCRAQSEQSECSFSPVVLFIDTVLLWLCLQLWLSRGSWSCCMFPSDWLPVWCCHKFVQTILKAVHSSFLFLWYNQCASLWVSPSLPPSIHSLIVFPFCVGCVSVAMSQVSVCTESKRVCKCCSGSVNEMGSLLLSMGFLFVLFVCCSEPELFTVWPA